MGKNKNKQQQKKAIRKQQEHNSRQQEKQEERKSKRERRKEKNKFNKAKYESDMTKFRLQLHQYGLKVKEMGADGNCLFRAIADQLEGNEKLHRKYRQDAIDYLELHKEEYAPFIEDDETIDQYLGDMAKDAVWGGQLELQVLSIIYKFNYIVHQVDNPIMAFSNFPWGSVPTLHISYHLGQHYNSVRLLEDPGDGPCMPIGHELQIKHPIIKQNPPPEEEKKQEEPEEEKLTLIQYALNLIGVQQPDSIDSMTEEARMMEEALISCFGQDIDNGTVSYLNINQVVDIIQKSYDDLEVQMLQKQFQKNMNINESSPSKQNEINKTLSNQNNDDQSEEKKLAKLKSEDYILADDGSIKEAPKKNKNCPCSSKKKYKNCCYVSDLQKKTQYIEKITKKLEEQQKLNKSKSILLL